MNKKIASTIIAVLICVSLSAQEGSVLTNLNFSKKLKNWTINPESKGAISVEAGKGNNAIATLKINLSNKAIAELSQPLMNLEKGKTYIVTCWIKGENIVSSGFIGANIGLTESWDVSDDNLVGTFDWKQVRLSFLATEKTTSFSIKLGFWNNESSGTAWFKNLTIRELDTYVVESPQKHIRFHFPHEFIQPADKHILTNGWFIWIVSMMPIKTCLEMCHTVVKP